MRTFLVWFVFPSLLLAQTTSTVTAPVLGYFLDRGHGRVHPLTGIPGSGFAGDAVDTTTWRVIEFSPAQDYALAVDETAVLVRITFSDAAVTPIDGAISGVTRIAISPAGATALVYSETSGKAQIVRGTAVLGEIGLPLPVTALAVNDSGELALFAAQDGIVYSVAPGGAPQPVYQGGAVAGIAFLRNSREAVAAGAGQVTWIRDNAGVPSPVSLADVRNPRAIAVSESGDRALVADDAGGIISLPFSGEAASRISCACAAAQFQRLHGRDLFLLTSDLGSDPVVLDAGVSTMQVFRMAAEPRRPPVRSGDDKQ
jgi:hypothetical protein